MAHVDADRIANALFRTEIRALQDAYADAVTRRAWAELGDLFLPVAPIELNLADRVLRFAGGHEIAAFIEQAIERFAFFQFGIVGTRVRLRIDGDPDRATGRMYMTERRQTPGGHWSQIYGVYHDEYVYADDRWQFARRSYHSLARGERGAELFAFPDHIDLDDWHQ